MLFLSFAVSVIPVSSVVFRNFISKISEVAGVLVRRGIKPKLGTAAIMETPDGIGVLILDRWYVHASGHMEGGGLGGMWEYGKKVIFPLA